MITSSSVQGRMTRLRLPGPWRGVVLGLAALLFAVGCSDRPEPTATAPDAAPTVRRDLPGIPPDTLFLQAPDFERPTLAGDAFELSSTRGDVVLVNVWATWCLPCAVETPDLVALHGELQDQGVRFVGVSLDEGGFDDVRPFAEEYGIDYPLVLDDGALLDPYGGLVALPTTLLIDRDGVVRYRLRGLTSKEQLLPLLHGLLAEAPSNA